MEQFLRTRQLLVATLQGPQAREEAWEALVRRAVLGPGDDAREVYGQMLHARPGSDAAEKAVVALMHGIEKYSIDLQRHSPSVWNQFCAVLLHCLSGGSADKGSGEDAFMV